MLRVLPSSSILLLWVLPLLSTLLWVLPLLSTLLWVLLLLSTLLWVLPLSSIFLWYCPHYLVGTTLIICIIMGAALTIYIINVKMKLGQEWHNSKGGVINLSTCTCIFDIRPANVIIDPVIEGPSPPALYVAMVTL